MQFFVVIAQNVYAIYTDCDYDKRVEWVCAIYLSSLFVLFMNFFIRSYVRAPSRHQGKETSSSLPGHGEHDDLYSRTVGVNGHVQYHHSSAQSNKKDN